jgi:hypothetical protein
MTNAKNENNSVNPIRLLNASIKSQISNSNIFLSGELATLSISFQTSTDIENLYFGYSIFHESGLLLFRLKTDHFICKLQCGADSDYKMDFNFPIQLGTGDYYINIKAFSKDNNDEKEYFNEKKAIFFNVTGFLDIPFDGLVRMIPSYSIGIIGCKGKIVAENLCAMKKHYQFLGLINPSVNNAKGFIKTFLSESIKAAQNEQIALFVEIYNSSDVDWICEGSKPIYISYHWLDLTGKIIMQEGFRTLIPNKIIQSSGKVMATAVVMAPSETGDYLLELTLIQEGVNWFENIGFETAKIPVNIKGSI